jgi:hypothetical protein
LATLKITNAISLTSQGVLTEGKQGTAANPATTPYELTVTGTVHKRIGTAADEAETLIYDSTVDFPATWDYLFFWCDQSVQLNLVTSATGFTVEVTQYQPFVLSSQKILGQADATNLAAQATTTVIDEITMGNYDADATCNYVLILVD